MDWDELIPVLTGSGGSVVVAMLFAYAAYRFLEKHLIPMLGVAINRHLEQIDKLLEKHDITAKSVEDVSDEVTDLGRKVADCGKKLDVLTNIFDANRAK